MGITRAITVHSASVAGSATATIPVPVQNAETMLVVWTVTDSALVGDLGATTVKPYTPTETSAREAQVGTIVETLLPAVVVAAATRVGTVAAKTDRYDIRGLEKVELKVTNGAAGAKNVAVHVYLYG